MQLTIATTEGVARGEVKLIEIARDALMTTVAELISAELSIAPGNQRLLLNGAPLSMAGTASDRGLSDGDLVLVENTSPPPAAGAGPEAVEQLRSIMQNPQAQAQLRARNPAMARAIESGDEGALSQLASQLQAMIAQGHGRGGGGGGAPAPPGSDNPMSVEAQTAMMEHIRQQNVEKNMEQAIEHNPEAFGSVVMLFVDCKINNIAGVKAFVDSGAQATIISKACAQRCNLLRLLDTRFQGMARGVGTAKIYGRIHLSTLTLGEEFFDVTFIVMESVGGDYDMLLGLDMLRKHQASIDLRENCLRIGGAVVPFLQEKDIPKRMRDQSMPGQGEAGSAGAGPSGGTSGGQSGGGHRLGTAADAAPPTAAAPQVNEQAVSKLTELGFSREESIQALQACGGNADAAASMLFSGS